MSRRRLAVSRKFTSAVERVRWAQQDIVDLKEAGRQFFTSDVHKRISEIDSDGINYVDKIRFKQRMPSRITKLTVSAIENLRAALDHGACAVVPTKAKKRTSFPFGDSRREFKRHLKTKGEHLPDEIKSLFMTLKPYKRGNPPLWALNKLCNTHKHRAIIQPGIDIKNLAFAGDPPNSGLNSLLRTLALGGVEEKTRS